MALNISDFAINTRYANNKAHGDLGEKAVVTRLQAQGYTCPRHKNNLVDYDAFVYDKNGKTLSHELIEVKAHKSHNFYEPYFETLTLPFARCNDYDEYSKKQRLTLWLYWVDFRKAWIGRAKFHELIRPEYCDKKLFPELIHFDETPNLAFPRVRFEFFDDLTDEEVEEFYLLYPEEREKW